VTPPAADASPAQGDLAEAQYLLTTRAIRQRAEALYQLGTRGALASFAIDEAQLATVAQLVVQVTRTVYPDVRAIPNHTRFRHFDVGGVDRVGRLDAAMSARARSPGGAQGLSSAARLSAKFELAITSVLLDAGAGERWSYREPGGQTYTRSEGLAVASYHLFASGALSDDPVGDPYRADAAALARFGDDDLARALQVSADNPLPGLSGRASILRRLGEVIGRKPQLFGGGATTTPRLGGLGLYLAAQARETRPAGGAGSGSLPATAVLDAVLEALGDIWPGREVCAGRNLGDVWTHPVVGRVPFHKLSQWLTYSLCEPLEESGVRITDMDALTGLAEYRNGGLFVDGGVLVPRSPAVLSETHDVSSSLVVEWRALTVALLDRLAVEMRGLLGLTAAELPLAKVLEGGSWRAGRQLAQQRRPDGAPPLRIRSDGTVF
jgi:hypothetical protein